VLGRRVTLGVWCSHVHSADPHKQICSHSARRNVMSLFSARWDIGWLSMG
jgi:hypothetical protein